MLEVTAEEWTIERVVVDPYGAARALLRGAAAAVTANAFRLAALCVATAVVACIATALRRYRRARLGARGRVVAVLAPPEVDVHGGEALWRHLHNLLRPRWRRLLQGQPHVSFEYAWSDQGLSIRVWVPGSVTPGIVERAVEAAWPAARATVEDAPGGFESRRWVGGRFRLALPDWFPLRTDFDSDPLRALLAAATIERHGQEAIVQVLARPAGYRATARCRAAARQVRTGRSATAVARLLDFLLPSPGRAAVGDPTIGPDTRSIMQKAEGPLWNVAIRYGVTAGESESSGSLRARAHAVASAFAPFAGRNRLVRRRAPRLSAALSGRWFSDGDLLSVAELAALAHLPTDSVVPNLARAGARSVAPSAAIPARATEGKVLGEADAGPQRAVVLSRQDSRYHAHIMGSTGSGKSTLLTNMILSDVEAGRGAVVIDPKGDLVSDVLARLGAGDRRRAVILDPAVAEGRPKLNMLEVPEGVTPDLVVDHLVAIFSRIFERSWGPRLEDVLRSTCLTLMASPDKKRTLSDIPALLSLPQAWTKFIPANEDTELRGFWAWYEAQNVGQKAQIVGPLLYKLRAFLLRPFVREVVNAERSTLDMGGVLDGGLMLVRVPKGVLGEDTSRLLGSFVVAKVWQAATGRAALSYDARRDAAVYVDECQNFVSTLPRSFDEVLAESRGYGVSWVLAHQHLGQLSRDLRDGISANARNKVYFTMSPEDALLLQRHTTPRLTDHDLANLGRYQAAIRLVANGEDQPACTMRTLPARPVAA